MKASAISARLAYDGALRLEGVPEGANVALVVVWRACRALARQLARQRLPFGLDENSRQNLRDVASEMLHWPSFYVRVGSGGRICFDPTLFHRRGPTRWERRRDESRPLYTKWFADNVLNATEREEMEGRAHRELLQEQTRRERQAAHRKRFEVEQEAAEERIELLLAQNAPNRSGEAGPCDAEEPTWWRAARTSEVARARVEADRRVVVRIIADGPVRRRWPVPLGSTSHIVAGFGDAPTEFESEHAVLFETIGQRLCFQAALSSESPIDQELPLHGFGVIVWSRRRKEERAKKREAEE